jgi:biotin carboxylase
LLLIAPGTSYRVEAYAEAARALGVELVLATDVPAAFARYRLDVVKVDLSDPELAAEQLAQVLGARLDGALGTDETSAVIAAIVASSSGIETNTPQAVRATRNKILMRQALAAADVSQPRASVLEPGAAAVSLLGYPCVVKPSMLSGSQGVIRADDATSLARAVFRCRAILDRHQSPARTDPDFFRLLVEGYVDGPELAIEALMSRGRLEILAVFDKPDPLCGPFFEETLYVTPSRHPQSVLERVESVTRDACRALGFFHGPVHAELRIASDGPKLIEIAARSIGGLCSRTLACVAGNLEQLLIANAVGIESPQREKSEPAAGVMMIPIPKSGVLKRVHGIDRARSVPGVVDVTLSARPGDRLRALPEGLSYLGFIFSRGSSAELCEQALREAHAALRIELSPLLPLSP